jgi:hypothetical protein
MWWGGSMNPNPRIRIPIRQQWIKGRIDVVSAVVKTGNEGQAIGATLWNLLI